ncbi:hypothetical protein MRB53_037129 [Persea americana]|nr:hypothetical protein MRB53_037129 [Persea americana]
MQRPKRLIVARAILRSGWRAGTHAGAAEQTPDSHVPAARQKAFRIPPRLATHSEYLAEAICRVTTLVNLSGCIKTHFRSPQAVTAVLIASSGVIGLVHHLIPCHRLEEVFMKQTSPWTA